MPKIEEKEKIVDYVALHQRLLKNSLLPSLIVDSSDDAIITKTLDGVITSWNKGAEKIYGFTEEEVLGKFINILVPPNQPNELNEILKKIQAGERIQHYETKRRRKDGGIIDVSSSLSPIKDEYGNIIGASTITRDITGRIMAYQYSRSLIEASLDPLVTISPEGKITDVNEATIKITGYPRETLIGTDFSNYFTEPEKAMEGYQQVFKQGFVKDYPLTIRNVTGKLTEVLYNATVYKDEAGNVLGVFAAARDITETKRASQYARSLIEASLDPLVTISPEGKITDVNEASVKVTGVPREKLIGTDFSDFFTEPEKAREGYKQVFERGFVSDYPLTIRHINGQLTPVLYNASVYRDDKGNVLGVFAAARDITKQKEAEDKIKKIQIYTRTLIETSLDPQITKGPDGLITDVNEATVLVTGVPREKIIGTHFPNYFTEPDKAEEAYQEAFAKGVVRNRMLAIKHVSGKITDVLYNATVYKDENGNVQGVFASARDITDRKQAEEEIKRSQAYTRSLIEASLDPLVTISPEGKITDVNEATIKVTGVSREKLIGTDFSNYFTEPEKAREGYQAVLKLGFVKDYALTIRSAEGKLTDVFYNASVYKDEEGNVLGVFAAARDITETKQASKYARSLIEASLDPLVTISPEGKITDVNEATIIVTGFSREKLIGTDFSNYFTEPEKAREGYQQVLKLGYVKDYPLTIKSMDGKLTDVLYNASVYKDSMGIVLGVFAAARDVTAQKKLAEREVAEREKEMMRLAELEKFQKLTVGRELKMIELKKEIEDLRKKIGVTAE